MREIRAEVVGAAKTAAAAAHSLANADESQLETALSSIASRLEGESEALLQANARDLESARRTLSEAALDRLRLDEAGIRDRSPRRAAKLRGGR